MSTRTPNESIITYLQDVIASEKTFETQLRSLAKEATTPDLEILYSSHADETKLQFERLETRLKEIGGSPSITKSILAHLFALAPKTAQITQESADKDTQNLIISFAVENSEIAMYEALIAAAKAAGDQRTANLALEIQKEERVAAEKIWSRLPSVAARSFAQVTTMDEKAVGNY